MNIAVPSLICHLCDGVPLAFVRAFEDADPLSGCVYVHPIPPRKTAEGEVVTPSSVYGTVGGGGAGEECRYARLHRHKHDLLGNPPAGDKARILKRESCQERSAQRFCQSVFTADVLREAAQLMGEIDPSVMRAAGLAKQFAPPRRVRFTLQQLPRWEYRPGRQTG